MVCPLPRRPGGVDSISLRHDLATHRPAQWSSWIHTLDIYPLLYILCFISVHPGTGILPLWPFLRLLPSFVPVKRWLFFLNTACFSSLESRVLMTEGVVHCPQRQWDCGFGIFQQRQQKHVLLFLIILHHILRKQPSQTTRRGETARYPAC